MESITSATVKAHALETSGFKRKADHWLSRRNFLFKGKTPLEMMQHDPAQVEAPLTRIDHGVYA